MPGRGIGGSGVRREEEGGSEALCITPENSEKFSRQLSLGWGVTGSDFLTGKTPLEASVDGIKWI